VEAEGASLAALLADLDRRYPGIRFRMVDEQERIRRHMRVFVNGDPVFDLAHVIEPHDEVVIVQALSGG
jgi:sulfur carrier protein ThiS